ncbi:hypothetical protein BYT27DRAFT_7245950 [Phlegmacium glaucopus]|nr:hypothetical protein BYT27DRAFT_7245950 [Phlegmacium glaucopus]
MDFPVDNHRKWASEVQWTVGDYVTAATNNDDYGWCCAPSIVVKRTDVRRGNVTVPPHQNAGNDDHRSPSVVVKEVIYFHPHHPFSVNAGRFQRTPPFPSNTTRFQSVPPFFNQHHPFSANTARFQPTPAVFSQHPPFPSNTTCFQSVPPFFNQHHPFSANTARFQPTPAVFREHPPFPSNATRFQLVPPFFNQHHPFSANTTCFQPTPAVFSNTSRFQPTPPIDRPLDPPATYFDPPLPPQPIYHLFQHITAHFDSPPPILTCHYLL